MTRSMPVLAVALAAVLAAPVLASQRGEESRLPEDLRGMTLGTSMAAIEQGLESRGYDVTEIDREGGRYEVEARREGVVWEVYVDRESGEILRGERERD
jgi:uncharacterized membrane protein YkoI